MDTASIDLFRKEKRFFIPAILTNQLLELIKENGLEPICFSENKITQTIYLLDDEQSWSLGVSLKARRYLQNYSKSISLEVLMDNQFNFEIKKEIDGTETRAKEKQQSASLGEIVEMAKEKFSRVRPYLIVEYDRQHYISPEQPWCRVTVDRGIRFWFLPCGKTEAVCIKDLKVTEDLTRLEVKVDLSRETEISIADFLNRISELGAQPVISKKQEGLNLVKTYLDKEHSSPMTKELKDCEIEAKLTVMTSFDPNVFFASLKELFLKGVGSILLDPSYPFTMTTSSVNYYWGKRGGDDCLSEGIKILSRGITARPVFKSNVVMLNLATGMIKRREVKATIFSVLENSFHDIVSQNEPLIGKVEYAGFLIRTRKAIWLINELTGRVYHVSLDRCTAHGKEPLYQIEVEYSGKLKKIDASSGDSYEVEKEIIRETGIIAEEIMALAERKGVRLSLGKEKFVWLTEQ